MLKTASTAAAGCFITLVLSAAGTASAQGSASNPAANYPNRPVSVVITYIAGSSTDGEARLYTDKMQQSMGQAFVYDYRPGAGTTIGVNHFVNAAPDGHTIMIHNTSMAVFPNFYPRTNHEVVKRIETISILSSRQSAVIASTAALPGIRSMKDLSAYGKANPDKLNCITSGVGGITHIVCLAFAQALGIRITPVHYKGVSEGQVDLIAGRAQLYTGPVYSSSKLARAGKVHMLAIIDRGRSKIMPDVPTSDEQGYYFKYPSWVGAFAPPKTPRPIIDRLNAEFVKAAHHPDVVKMLDAGGSIPVGSSAEEFRSRYHEEMEYWKKIVDDHKITIE